MRRQNVYDHLNAEYGLDPTAVLRESDPEWKGGEPPPNDELEAKVNDINARIVALGPVNMVAIDEFRELEERYTKEKAQEADLLAAKEQILALITNLNEKSSDMFRSTFQQVMYLNIAAELLQISALTIVLFTMVQATSGILQGAGKQYIPMITLFIGVAMKIVLNYTLVRRPMPVSFAT